MLLYLCTLFIPLTSCDFLFLHFFGTPLSISTDGESKTKVKKDTSKGKAKKKKRKGNENEALEDSDDGDYEGLEVDYMSDESRSDSLCVAFKNSVFLTLLFVFLLLLVCNLSFHM